MTVRRQERRDTSANWVASTTPLLQGEIGVELNGSGVPIGVRFGDGTSLWAALPASAAPVVKDTLVVNVRDHGAVGNNTGDDYAGIAAAIAACPAGGIVYFPPGQYRVTQTIVVPANVTLMGADGYRYQQYTGINTYIKPVFGNFTGTALISCVDEADGWQLRDLALSGVSAVNLSGGGPVHGLSSTGFVKGVKLQDVLITGFTGDGVHTDTTATGQPGGWEVRGLYSSINNYGWYSADSAAKGIAFTDSKITFSECAANALDGWRIDSGPTNDFIGVWATWNNGNGFYINTKASNLQFTACQTDRNAKNGWYLKASEQVTTNPSPRVVTFTGCIANRDGRNANGGQGGYAGLRVEGTSTGTPHIGVVGAPSSHVGVDDDNTGQRSPDYGIYATNASRILLNAGFQQGTIASVFDDNESISDPGTVEHTTSDFTTGTVTDLGQLGGIPSPRPADFGYKAWNYDPVVATQSGTPVGGVVLLQRIQTRGTKSVSKIVYAFPSTASMALTSGQCFVGLYNSAGTRVAVSADISASVTQSEVAFSLTGAVTLTPGSFYWAALLLNGTTLPTLARGPSLGGQGQTQVGVSAARWGSILTGQTTLPSSITPGSIAKAATYWVAVL